MRISIITPCCNAETFLAETIRSVVVEGYNYRIENESLLFHEMCGYMGGKGFRCIDLCDPVHRPKDGALWQSDLFFLPAAREEFTSNRYSWAGPE